MGVIRMMWAAVFAGVVSVGAWWAAPASADGFMGVPSGERRVIARLDRVVSVDYRGVALADALEDLRVKTGANFEVRWDQLEAAGVSRDETVEVRLREVPARVALRRVLRYVDVGFEPIGYSIGGGLVTVSSQRQLDRRMVTRVYDVRGVAFPVRDFVERPRLDLEAALNGGLGGGGDLIERSEAAEANGGAGTADEVRRLVKLLREMVLERGA
ncbi:MAG: hypothetical protein AAF078_11380 [Planctomycetota bacterium]